VYDQASRVEILKKIKTWEGFEGPRKDEQLYRLPLLQDINIALIQADVEEQKKKKRSNKQSKGKILGIEALEEREAARQAKKYEAVEKERKK